MIRKKISEDAFLRTGIYGGSVRIAALTSTVSITLLLNAQIANCNALSMLRCGFHPSLLTAMARKEFSAKRQRPKFAGRSRWPSTGNDKKSCSANRIKGAIAIHRNADVIEKWSRNGRPQMTTTPGQTGGQAIRGIQGQTMRRCRIATIHGVTAIHRVRH